MLDIPASKERILQYGTVELCLYPLYTPGEIIPIAKNFYISIVNRAEAADGIIILGSVPSEIPNRRPTTICVLFTHFYRKSMQDTIDHARTNFMLKRPTSYIREATRHAFCQTLAMRSFIALVSCAPIVAYL